VLACALVVPATVLAISLSFERQYLAEATLSSRFPPLSLETARLLALPPSRAPSPLRDAVLETQPGAIAAAARRTAAQFPNLDAEQVKGRIDVESPPPNVVARSAQLGAPVEFSVKARGRTPQGAADLANGFARQYVQFRRDAIDREIAARKSLAELRRGLTASGRGSLAARDEELDVLAALEQSNVVVARPADPPGTASTVHPLRNTLAGAALGLALGISLSALLDRYPPVRKSARRDDRWARLASRWRRAA
jgi:hypothetical protein